MLAGQSTTPQYFINSETELEQSYRDLIQPFWQQQVQQGFLAGQDQIKIAYAYVLHPQAIGSIVISSGRIEGLLKYQEVIYELYQNGYSVFIHDHRGQGLSSRIADNPHKGHVESFEHYVQDMQLFYQQIVQVYSQHHPMLLCHSMGSAIGALYQLNNPGHFSKVVYSAPMFGIKSPLPQWLVKPMIDKGQKLNQKLSQQPWFFLGQGQYKAVPFAINPLTHSKNRYSHFRHIYQQHPELQLGGVTFHWLQQAILAMDEISQRVKELTTPSLLLQAGGDIIVDNKAQNALVAQMPNCQQQVIDKGRHELLMEADPYRQQVMTHILDFFQDK